MTDETKSTSHDIDRLRPDFAHEAAALVAQHEAEVAALKAEVESMAAKNQHLRATLIDLRMQYHAAGRRPEECHEMSMIDEALRMAMRNADTGEAE